MKFRPRLVVISLTAIFLLYFLKTWSPNLKFQSTNPNPVVDLNPTPTVLAASSDNGHLCRIRGLLPDQNCTPGVTDPQVTQENIFQTICKKGYTATVRPLVSYTNKLKIKQINDYGYADTSLKDYEEDHLISLELGGSPTDPLNLWPEPGNSPNPKDKIENLCHSKVCSGEISLHDAQTQIATDWTTACQ